jgi:mevalonate kinase
MPANNEVLNTLSPGPGGGDGGAGSGAGSGAATESSAPGKIILFGEHAVVYGRPAIASPVMQVRAYAWVEDSSSPGVWLNAPDIDRSFQLENAGDHDPFARAVNVFVERSGLSVLPDLSITVSSTIPMASGMGSGAALAAAVIRALALHLGKQDLARAQQVSAMTYEVEKLLHGTPSGIDNTVVSYEKPVYFVRQQPENLIETLSVEGTFRFVIADSGVTGFTREIVGDVRRQWRLDENRFESLFDTCGHIAKAARKALEDGDSRQLGLLMRENQITLNKMTVSSDVLERLIQAAEGAGALGAKLSGAGRGGNIIALVNPDKEEIVREALLAAGAVGVITSSLGYKEDG